MVWVLFKDVIEMPWYYQEQNRILKEKKNRGVDKKEKNKTILMYEIKQNKRLYFTLPHIENVTYL